MKRQTLLKLARIGVAAVDASAGYRFFGPYEGLTAPNAAMERIVQALRAADLSMGELVEARREFEEEDVKTVSCTCAKCGKPFRVIADRVAGGGGRFCSQKCAWHGRGARRLTDEQIRVIRSSSDPGRTLAARFDVHESLISLIRTGKRFREVTP